MARAALLAFFVLAHISAAAAQTAGEVVPSIIPAAGAVAPPPSEVQPKTVNPATVKDDATSRVITRTTQNPKPVPAAGAAIPITTVVKGVPSQVTLLYAVNYTAEQLVPMTPSPGGVPGTYEASIPAGVTDPGSMVRWAIQVVLPDGTTDRDPVFANANSTQYYGTIIPNPATAQSVPLLEWYTQDPGRSQDQVGAAGSVFFNGRFYDNILVARKGVTSLGWPKPKLKLRFHKGNLFDWKEGRKPVKKIDISSNWKEPGQNSYLREFEAYNVLNTSGVSVPDIFHIVVNLNNAFFGFYDMKGNIDADFLQYNGYSPTGDLFKALDGTNSNLRYDVPTDQMQFYYKLEGAGNNVSTNATDAAAYKRLKDFTVGISGGSPVPRSKYVFDNLNLPTVIDEMAALTMMLGQDRLTKNYFVYRDDKTGEWTRFPWDVKSSFATDRGLGGQPAPDYCILACEQWNSPLYGDLNHPQDLDNATPWSIITPSFGTFSGGAAAGRKLLGMHPRLAVLAQQMRTENPGRKLAQAVVAAPSPNGATEAGVDIDRTTVPSQQGPNGTFNYLIDVVLSVPPTRAMYLRRLRTLMDFWLGGRIEQNFQAAFDSIRPILLQDNAKWKGGDPDIGIKQMLTETLPIRKKQLYDQYGPDGPVPLIPAEQSADAALSIGTIEPSPASPDEGYIQLVNPNSFAMDVSGFQLSGGPDGPSITLAPGTVIPAPPNEPFLYLSPDVSAFRKRATTPTGGEGHFVQGPLSGTITLAVPLTITNPAGTAVPLVPRPAAAAAPAAAPAAAASEPTPRAVSKPRAPAAAPKAAPVSNPLLQSAAG